MKETERTVFKNIFTCFIPSQSALLPHILCSFHVQFLSVYILSLSFLPPETSYHFVFRFIFKVQGFTM